MQPTRDAATALGAWTTQGASAQGRFRFAAALPVFLGHFPSQPLLPGVYHLAAMAHLAGVALPDARLVLILVDRAKWSAPAYPERDLEVQISWKSEGQGGHARLVVDGTVTMEGMLCASARLVFGGERLPGG